MVLVFDKQIENRPRYYIHSYISWPMCKLTSQTCLTFRPDCVRERGAGDRTVGFGEFLCSIASSRPVLICSGKIAISQVVLWIKSYNRYIPTRSEPQLCPSCLQRDCPLSETHSWEVYTKMSVNHMFYTEASERKRNKGEDQEIVSEFLAVCTHRLLLISHSTCSSVDAHPPVLEQQRGTSTQRRFYFRIGLPQLNLLPDESITSRTDSKSRLQ